MPTISIFFGILIQMHWKDHAPPHFHATYGNHEAQFEIRTLRLMKGSLPPRAMSMVRDWADANRDTLLEDWTLCSQLIPPHPIAPLE